MSVRRYSLVFVSILICFRGVFAEADSDCDPGLPINKANPLSYRERENRCEGLYVLQLAGEALRIAEFAVFPDNFKPEKAKPLLITWPKAAAGEIHIRAISLRPKLYYRMDSVRLMDGSPFKWQTDILTASLVNLSRREIGITGLVTIASSKQTKIYLPLSIESGDSGSKGEATIHDSYDLVLLPAVQLEEVYFTLCPYDNGKVGDPIKKGVPLEFGYYPADEPITVKIPFSELAPSHVYYFSVGATLKNGSSTSVDGYFLHPVQAETSMKGQLSR
jgi:hypothetical protein